MPETIQTPLVVAGIISAVSVIIGAPGDWIVIGRNGYYPEAFTPADFAATFEVVA